jgi:tetratricopeptide (TPR) repeat protein
MRSTRGIGFALVALGNWRVAKAFAISNVEHINLRAQTIIQNPACYRLILNAQAALERALALDGLDAEVITEGHLSLAFVHFLLQKLDLARQQALQTLEQAHKKELTRLLGRSLRLLGFIFAAQDQPEQASTYFEQALEVFNTYDMRLDYARTLQGLGIILCWDAPGQETYKRGCTFLQKSRDIFSACGATFDLDLVQHFISHLEKSIAE